MQRIRSITMHTFALRLNVAPRAESARAFSSDEHSRHLPNGRTVKAKAKLASAEIPA